MVLAVENDLLSQGRYLFIGPGATTDKGGGVSEIYENTIIYLYKDAPPRIISDLKRITLNKKRELTIEPAPSQDRIILTQLTVTNLDRIDKNAHAQPFFLKITGGNQRTAIEDALQVVLEKEGIQNACYFIVAYGSDMLTKTAVIDSLPPQNTIIASLDELLQIQGLKDYCGGIIMIAGHFTPHHPFEILESRTGKKYLNHQHGIGTHGNLNFPQGGHINAMIPGPETTTYIIVKPVEKVIEIDASPSV